jgi:hypothetical protein
MDDSELSASVERAWSIYERIKEALAKRRGYADFFGWDDKQVAERGIVSQLLEEIVDEPAGPFRDLVSRGVGADPPDCEMRDMDGRRIGIEVTELVDEDAIRRSKRDSRFLMAGWDQATLIARLEARIRQKDAPKVVHGGPYDEYWLLLHTDEGVLTFEAVSGWLAGFELPKRSLLTRVYLLFSYSPGLKKYPYLRLA